MLVEDVSEAEVRFANNTATTNGLRRNRRVSVIAIVENDGALAAGVATRSGAPDVADLVRAAEANARSAPPANDAAALVTGSADEDFALAPPETDLSILDGVLPTWRGPSSAPARTTSPWRATRTTASPPPTWAPRPGCAGDSSSPPAPCR